METVRNAVSVVLDFVHLGDTKFGKFLKYLVSNESTKQDKFGVSKVTENKASAVPPTGKGMERQVTTSAGAPLVKSLDEFKSKKLGRVDEVARKNGAENRMQFFKGIGDMESIDESEALLNRSLDALVTIDDRDLYSLQIFVNRYVGNIQNCMKDSKGVITDPSMKLLAKKQALDNLQASVAKLGDEYRSFKEVADKVINDCR